MLHIWNLNTLHLGRLTNCHTYIVCNPTYCNIVLVERVYYQDQLL
jgi:hypothetical protein